MKTFAAACLSGALCLTGATAMAASNPCGGSSQTHDILIYKRGMFPTTTYVCTGDYIRVQNVSGYWMQLTIEGGKIVTEVLNDPTALQVENLPTGWIANGSTYGPVRITGKTGSNLFNLTRWTGSSTTWGYGGSLSRDLPPTSY